MNSDGLTIWDILGIAATGDERSIKRAYAKLLKSNRPDDDPDAFQRLRDAYEYALRIAPQLRDMHDDVGEPARQPAPDAATAPLSLAKAAPAVNCAADAPAVADAPAAAPPGAPAPRERLRPRALPPPPPPQPPDAATVRAQMADAAAQAHALWRAFLETPPASPRLMLTTLDASDAMLNLMVRDAVELEAVRHCAGAHCPELLREAIVKHFRWHDSTAHLVKLDPQAANAAMGRYQASQSLEYLQTRAGHKDVMQVLLAGERPRFGRRTPNVKFTQAMRAMTETIRLHHPEVLAYGIDSEVFELWERKVDAKRYFVQSVAFSFFGGLLLHLLAYEGASYLDSAALRRLEAYVFYGAQAVSFALFALYAFFRPRKLIAALRHFKDQRLDYYLHVRRYQNAWQHGWLLPFFVLSLLMFLPDPGQATRFAVSAGMFGCMLAALFAGSAMLNRAHWFAVALFTLLLGFAMASNGFGEFGLATCLFASACTALQAVRGGQHLYLTTQLPPALLPKLRGGWLAGCVALFFCLDGSLLAAPALALLTWIWCFAGLMLSRFVFAAIFIWPGLLAVRLVIAGSGGLLNPLRDPRLPLLIPALLAIAFFMLVNMYHSMREDLHFS